MERENSLLFVGAGASVEVGGAKIGTLGVGGAATRDIKAGRNIITVRTTTAPGQFVVQFDAKAGKTYNFLISPKSDALLLGSAFGLVGDAVNASISDTSGYFQIEMVQ